MPITSLYEQEDLLTHKYLAFFMGFSFSVIGIFFSLFLFPENPGIVAVAFSSMMFLTVFKYFFDIVKSYYDLIDYYIDLFELYIFLFFGAFAAFMIFAIMLPELATTTFFKEQMRIFGISRLGTLTSTGLSTGLAFASADFLSILSNNLVVYLFCFVVAFIFGSGAIFLLIWNASVWGTLFGFTMQRLDARSSTLLLLSILPHTFLEVSSYVLAAISGIVLSSIISKKEMFNKKNFIIFISAMLIAVLLLIIAALVEVI